MKLLETTGYHDVSQRVKSCLLSLETTGKKDVVLGITKSKKLTEFTRDNRLQDVVGITKSQKLTMKSFETTGHNVVVVDSLNVAVGRLIYK